MNVFFDASFEKSLRKLKNKDVQSKVWETILVLEEAVTLRNVPDVKKMEGFKTFYRIKLGQYRLGFELINPNTVLLILVAHRKDIYRYFP
jgi:mRNA interferase RelE/StbE